ncbi:helix-turn-helix transcriptional regulator [Streptomyces sp. AS02]|uniref:helix-turn-helix domain-containing protein n=1 Tax=Streptomyces sp. AS02 TaxID=2938946 RepID=UPI00202159AE|nr:helix-turn-helix transcriptional regulator [Streptomyces sp. AS02]MCL8016919.1 helix-turn-helix domain-containing protein [Streptomyces sp. AS02]
MSRPLPEHGTPARYKGRQDVAGCRCRPCTKAASRADAERRLDRLAGNPRSADATLFRRTLRHLRYLVANDMSHAQIGKSAGVSQSTVSQLLSGQRTSLMSDTARKLLAVEATDRSGTHMAPAVGTMRRLQALYWMGHRSQTIADRTGLHEDTVLGLARGRWERTTSDRVSAVLQAYDELAMSYGDSPRARQFAADNNWHGPLAWDDDTIDDPHAVPSTDAVAPVVTEGGNVAARWLLGESVILGREDRREVLAHLFEWTGGSPEEIAARLDMTSDAASRAWERIKAKAAADGRRLWRRVYVPRLKQNDMEEAA